MGKLIYMAIQSLDGYTEDVQGRFDWSVPSEELHGFINDLIEPIGTYLYGRRMYEVMKYWESEAATGDDVAQVEREFAAIWMAADKVVYSTTLTEVSTSRTRLERQFDPAAINELKATSSRDLTIDGPTLAAEAIRAGLVDEYHLFLVPVLIGGGKRFVPEGIRIGLELLEERRFDNGTVYLRYRPGS